MAKGAKWGKLREKYPRLPMDADYASKVDAVLNSPVPEDELIAAGLGNLFVDVPLRTLANTEVMTIYRHYRKVKEEIEASLSTINLQLEAAEFKLQEHFEANDLLTEKFADGASITVAPDPVVNVSDETAFYGWVKSDEQRRINFKLREYINPQTAKAQVKALLETNQPLPVGVEVFYVNKLTLRGAK